MWRYYLSRDTKEEKETAMAKAERIMRKRVLDRGSVWCESNNGQERKEGAETESGRVSKVTKDF